MSTPAVAAPAPTTSNTPFDVHGFDAIVFAVGNAFQSAHFFVSAFGMTPVAYRGPETGSPAECSYVLRSGAAVFVVTGATRAGTELGEHVHEHGDGVIDIGLAVSDVGAAYDHALAQGARGLVEPHQIRDGDGTVTLATIAAYGQVRHTFVDRSRYHGVHLPGYTATTLAMSGAQAPYFHAVDHCVAAVAAGRMDEWVDFYQRIFGFATMAEFVDGEISTKFSALRSRVVADPRRLVRFPVVEPAESARNSQVDEFLQFYGCPGVQHVALATDDILTAIDGMRARGVEFLPTPATYYDDPGLLDRMGPITTPIAELARRGALVDRDEHGHLLQILTRPPQDRPTGFFELIERHGSQGFGVGNFAALFQAIEREQDRRGNL
ncbi:4-hydroxyphenylpyruvate dioxygenase [Nocardia sp. CDC159]|uniref:4-hydroxyphenylpyruvate dioxygenase n=1 Tax=Nocardia pulmonis TaxID=2951408 RepID=A0A9X2J0B5_9NOCA|nr:MULTISPECIES: 4-hydroxyphenylpyruvate dioxygenase [Nocardia]MCM6778388.1 4-hydroxyphenylpyruvate dioxygenase [Nocardia pulmonis]MCM6791216.1 4-hydroxyphenylpyruvate dioxygenase [Nocardia sp. CDC159]